MADVTITAANVTAAAGATIENGTAGAAVTAGQVVYRDPVTKKYALADSNGSANAKNARGFAMNGAAINQPIAVATGGPINIGGTLVAGAAYFLSDTPGGVAPFADVGTGETSVLLGVATSTGVLRIVIQNSGVTLA